VEFIENVESLIVCASDPIIEIAPPSMDAVLFENIVAVTVLSVLGVMPKLLSHIAPPAPPSAPLFEKFAFSIIFIDPLMVEIAPPFIVAILDEKVELSIVPILELRRCIAPPLLELETLNAELPMKAELLSTFKTLGFGPLAKKRAPPDCALFSENVVFSMVPMELAAKPRAPPGEVAVLPLNLESSMLPIDERTICIAPPTPLVAALLWKDELLNKFKELGTEKSSTSAMAPALVAEFCEKVEPRIVPIEPASTEMAPPEPAGFVLLKNCEFSMATIDEKDSKIAIDVLLLKVELLIKFTVLANESGSKLIRYIAPAPSPVLLEKVQFWIVPIKAPVAAMAPPAIVAAKLTPVLLVKVVFIRLLSTE
jgi:hypothetical protein